jgi:hypothetical protein
MTATKAGSAFDALTYEAPFLIEKLLKDYIAETPAEAEALFTEFKRYVVFVCSDDRSDWQMYSLRVDEVWHQFVLFTWEYVNFCQNFFGRYIHHNPSNAPEHNPGNVSESSPTVVKTPTSFEDFKNRYQALFGEPLPDVWYDEKSVTTRRRVINKNAGKLTLKDGDEDGTIDLVGVTGEVLVSLNEIAREALAFIAQNSAFYVRELPGDLTDEERVALIATLVEHNLLRVAS